MSKKEKKDQKEQELAVTEAESEATTEAAEAEQPAADVTEEAAAESEPAEEKAEKKEKEKKPKKNRTPEAEKERALNRVKRLKKLKYGTLATVITIVFVAIVVLANVVCSVLDNRYHWNIDLTSSGLYEIDEQTIEYLHHLNTDVTLTMLADESYFLENETYKLVGETLDRFKAESNGHITVEYVDPTKNPEAVQRYTENYSGSLTRGDLVVANGDLVRVLGLTTDLFQQTSSIDYSTYQQTTSTSFIGEQSIISAIMGVTDLNPVSVAVISKSNGNPIYNDYDAYSYARMIELLEKNNYNVTEFDIAGGALDPAIYDAAILCSPYNDLTDAQIEKLNDFLYNFGKYGKTMVCFGSILQREATANLDSFLDTWGIEIGKAQIIEGNNAAAQVVQTAMSVAGGVPVVTATNADLNAAFSAGLPVVAPYCCPVITKWDTNAGRTTTPLLVTSDTCYLHPLNVSSEEFDESTAEHGSFNLAVSSKTTFTEGSETYSSTMIVYGSAWFLDYAVAGSSGTYDNAAYFISTLNTATGKESVLTIAEKSLDKTKLTISTAQALAIRNVTILVIPLVVALIGVFVYIRRRNR